jgi:hypothetical protein
LAAGFGRFSAAFHERSPLLTGRDAKKSEESAGLEWDGRTEVDPGFRTRG